MSIWLSSGRPGNNPDPSRRYRILSICAPRRRRLAFFRLVRRLGCGTSGRWTILTKFGRFGFGGEKNPLLSRIGGRSLINPFTAAILKFEFEFKSSSQVHISTNQISCNSKISCGQRPIGFISMLKHQSYSLFNETSFPSLLFISI